MSALRLHRWSHRWSAWVCVAVGVVLVVGSALAWSRGRPAPTDAGELPVVVTMTTTVVASSTAPDPVRPAPVLVSQTPTTVPGSNHQDAPAATPGESATQSPRASGAAEPAAEPAVLSLPTLGVTADVGPVASLDGVLQVPDDVNRVGWWTGSAGAGSATGSTVIDGHIDSAVQGEGALFHLADLSPGDPITVRTTTGRTLAYTVAARRVYVKADGLPADIFADPGYPRLVLISCGGSFDKSERSYNDNVVIFATPDV